MDDAAYCAEVLAPIWERWTDNSPLLRQALGCAHGDEAIRAAQRERLLAAIREMVPRRDDPGVNAAVCAALAALCVLGGDMDTDFQAVAAQAVAKDQEARGRPAPAREAAKHPWWRRHRWWLVLACAALCLLRVASLRRARIRNTDLLHVCKT